jgi:hypothetical protein
MLKILIFLKKILKMVIKEKDKPDSLFEKEYLEFKNRRI